MPQPIFCLGVHVEEADKLVLLTIASMIHEVIMTYKLMNKNSFGLRTSVPEFYTDLLSRGKVNELYRIDLSKSLSLIDPSIVLKALEPAIGNQTDVFDIVKSFLDLPYLDDESREELPLSGKGIPPIGHITNVLWNFFLNKLDNEFEMVYPEITYSRYINEVFISNCPDLSIEDLYKLLGKFNLEGNIYYINPGDNPLPCHVGLISIEESSGNIKVESKSQS